MYKPSHLISALKRPLNHYSNLISFSLPFRHISGNTKFILKAVGDKESAQQELGWLQEHVRKVHGHERAKEQRNILRELCRKRSHFVPLQWLLGTQPFGELEIKCRREVLIPRYVSR